LFFFRGDLRYGVTGVPVGLGTHKAIEYHDPFLLAKASRRHQPVIVIVMKYLYPSF
jgi:hypothetical protein